ncbi:MAG: hypothetical protein ACLFV2_06320 [Desulfurivibrionaceae bacterium]
MIKLLELMAEFEKSMSAAAFAEQGEYATARQIIDRSAKSNKRVLLGTDELELDPKIIKYTLKLCQRMEGGLEILHVNPTYKGKFGRHKKRNFFQDSLSKMYEKKMFKKGIVYQPVWSEKSIVEEIVDYVAPRRHIISVVLRSPDYFADSSKGVRRKDVSILLQKIQCPVVFYGDTP